MIAFLGFVAFAFAFYLFLVTNNKIKGLKNSLLIEDTKKEIEALITEFNRAAARNIELLEDKITTIQDLIKKADIKILKLEELSRTSSRPVIVEKIVERKVEQKDIDDEKRIPVQKKDNKPEERIVKAEENLIEKEKNSRIEKLKSLLSSGKTKEDLLSMGFMENEINLVLFLVKTKKG
ncbi:MAG: hypothetical protein ACP5QT_04805 [Brevinematia bacterium]